MIQRQIISTFDDLSQKHLTWIIKYHTTNFERPVFLIWYTDTDKNSTDRLLTYKSGEIFCVKSLKNIKAIILASINNLNVFENLYHWLNEFENLEIVENCSYDIAAIETAIGSNNLDIQSLESFTNFINLFGDFRYQDDRNAHLHIYMNDKLIKKTWDSYYNNIFWPGFKDKEKFEIWDNPRLNIDTRKLLIKFKNLVKIFDSNIKQGG